MKAEHCRQIDARRWQREGIFGDFSAGIWEWRDGETGARRASIGYSGGGSAVVLSYRVNDQPMRQCVSVLRTACNYGGSRAWFACPRCGRRVAVLYLRGHAGFVCRHCGNIAYSSQSEDQIDRAWRRQRKAEARLGEHWQRPKGMHQTTHSRTVKLIIECEAQREGALAAYLLQHMPERFRS